MLVASSRKTAVDIKEFEKINFEDNIIFDFDWIKVASHSFIDELIGPYIKKYEWYLKIWNLEIVMIM